MDQSAGATLGYLMVISAAIFWGLSGTCAQFLFEHKAISPAWLVSWRLLLAGFLLVTYGLTRKNSDIIRIWRKPSDVIQLLFFSIIGMVAVQFTYFYSINLSNAATATVLQYIGPCFVVAYYALKNRKWPTGLEYLALFLALAGTFLVVTHGSFQTLVLSGDAVLWGMLSAISLAFYTVFPVQLLRRFSAITVTGWAMLLGGVVFSIYSKPFEMMGIWDGGTCAAFIFIIIFGTVVAFTLFMSALNRIGAQTASLLCSVEPLAATLAAVYWLQVSFLKMDWLGTLLIVATVFILAINSRKKGLSI